VFQIRARDMSGRALVAVRISYCPHVSTSSKRRSSNSHMASPSKPHVIPFLAEVHFHSWGAGVADFTRKDVVAANPSHKRSTLRCASCIATAWAAALSDDGTSASGWNSARWRWLAVQFSTSVTRLAASNPLASPR